MIRQLPIGRLVCWKRRVDEAYQPRVDQGKALNDGSATMDLGPILNPLEMQKQLLEPILRAVP